jgi:hypothetical protein
VETRLRPSGSTMVEMPLTLAPEASMDFSEASGNDHTEFVGVPGDSETGGNGDPSAVGRASVDGGGRLRERAGRWSRRAADVPGRNSGDPRRRHVRSRINDQGRVLLHSYAQS